MTTLLNGVLGGALAALVAVTVVTSLPVGPSPLRSRGDDPRYHRGRTSLVAVGYGALAGGVGVAVALAGGGLGVPPSRVVALGAALGWSVLLCGVVTVGWRLVAGSRDRWRWLAAFHLVFGVALGVWVRLTWVT